MSVPVPTSAGRSGFGPQLSLSYDSGAGNGAFGFGWSLSSPAIVRKTEKGLPRYRDDEESDVFILSGAEDLVPVRLPNGKPFEDLTSAPGFSIRRYCPRVGPMSSRIERWTQTGTGEMHWRSITSGNATTLYGRTNESRVFDPACADPAHPTRIFAWLICESFDDRGNVIEYGYKAEDSAGVAGTLTCEANRTPAQRGANRYLKRIRYGNTVSRLDTARFPSTEWLFELVLDYGEHHPLTPTPGDAGAWACRNDPFSSYRSGFEVRTYRLCRRFLMFHHFRNEAGVGTGCLVRSLDLRYRSTRGIPSDAELGNPAASFIESLTSAGYRRTGAAGYARRALPALELTYSDAAVSDIVHEMDDESLENLPAGLELPSYQWLDLFGEGVSGIFSEQANAWLYKRNLSPASDPTSIAELRVRFAPVELVGQRPNVAMAGQGAQLMDLAGDGQPDVVVLDGPMAGFFEVEESEEWSSFRPFTSRPTVSSDDPNLRFIDLDGDGHADLLVTTDRVFTWYPSLAEDGFGAPVRVAQPVDDESGPALLFADGTQSIHLADMSGDGLTDIVRITNGEVCYWPNIGYGRFGAKVTMDNSPWYATAGALDHRRIRIADIDGSGTVDIIYLDPDGARLYFNRSGNAWSEAQPLKGFPRIDDVVSVTTVDLFGNGTACLVWSSSLSGDRGRQMRYVDLMGGQKPHLLLSMANNLGAEVRVQYASSAKFYVRDKLAGKPWITKLPFPVHVVERVDTLDRISGNAFVARYAYHHGYFDGEEREFRGFGMVEQWDTEEFALLAGASATPPANIDAASHVPPVHTRSWFHTGVFIGGDRVSQYFAGLWDGLDVGEYYREPAWRANDAEAKRRLLDDTILPNTVLRQDGSRTAYTLTSGEEREACRALRGAMLRQEIYALDGSALAEHPYVVREQNFTIELLQPRGDNRHAVFFSHPRESLEHHYEREHRDPRVAHDLTLDVDAFGNVLRSASVAYGRRHADASIPDASDRAEQTRLHITCSEHRVTNAVDIADAWRTPLAVESRNFELTGLALAATDLRFSFAQMASAVAGAKEIAFEVDPQSGAVEKRVIGHERVRYRPNDLGASKNDPLALLPLAIVESMAIGGESFTMAFTPGLIAGVYGTRVTNAMLQTEGRYVHSEGDANWWAPSGRMFYSAGSADSAAQELAQARQHFFLPRRFRDPFHSSALPTEIVVTYDAYDLLLLDTRDALGNRVTAGERDTAGAITLAGNDYRVLQPRVTMDANRNRSAVAFDALGLVVGTAVMGKPSPSPAEGDSLSGFDADLADAVVLAHLAAPLTNPQAVLQRASARLMYDLFAYQRTKGLPRPQPAVVYAIARETHDSEPVPAGGVRLHHSFSYSDGFGREIQKKMQAEPGPTPNRPASGTRWIGSGWTVFNNKGMPVRQFEPFFSDTHHFERDVRAGVSSILFYDPVGRVVATLHPNHTWGKGVFGPWREETWDANDTVLVADPKTDLDVGKCFARLSSAEYLPGWHAQRVGGALGPDERDAALKSAVHAATPAVTHADSLGRGYLTVAHNRAKYSDTPAAAPPIDELLRTRVTFDIQGGQRSVTDAKGRVVMRYFYDIVGNRIHQTGMEAGAHWSLSDVTGKPFYTWDSRDHRLHSTYDALRRPTEVRLKEGAGAEQVVGRSVYGEAAPNAEANNLRGKVTQLFDQAGVVTSVAYDFKGNLLRSERQLARAYSATLDWSSAVPLAVPIYRSRTRYDAVNRPIQLVAPHGNQAGAILSVLQPTYNEAGLLERVDTWLDQGAEPAAMLAPASATVHAVTNIDYDAKGQRTALELGNGVRTTYAHDPLTFRLANLVTKSAGVSLQDLHYSYDPVSNITHIRDDAQQTVFFSNRRVEPSADFTYDALYRLIEGTGREHLGQAGRAPRPSSYDDSPRAGIAFASSDGTAMGRYLERYVYDKVGNFNTMRHVGSDPANAGWTRTYAYGEPSQLEAGKRSNRLTSSATDPLKPEVYSVAGNGYDAHGNMLRMPQLQEMRWDFGDRLRMTRRQAVSAADADGTLHSGERTWYVYDAGGQRVRKVTESSPGVIAEERIYLGGVEIFRRVGVKAVERESLHIMDGARRIVLVETRTAGSEPGVARRLVRYQFDNHLGSASLELDEQAKIISYEEYTPYGSTSYQAVRSQTEAAKRYRFTGKERDEESGLYYHGARYYAPWLGRWTSCDPISLAGGINLMVYCRGNPVNAVDPDGRDETTPPSNPSPPTVPEVGKHPEGLLAESEFNSHWEAALEWRYGQGTLQGNLGAARDKIQGAADPSVLGRKEYKSIYGRFRQEIAKDVELSKYSWEGTELHHIDPVTVGDAADAGAAVDPTGIAFARGKAKVSGTSHNALHNVPENPAPENVVRLEAYAKATKGRPDGRPVTPPASPPAAKAPAASPPPPAAAPSAAEPVAKGGTAATSEAKPAVAPLAEAVTTTAGPSRSARAAAWSLENGPKVLKFAGKVVTVYGAHTEAQRSAAKVEGEFNKNAAYATTFTAGIVAGVFDDALAILPQTSGFVQNSWETNNAGPTQVLAGDALRAFNGWVMRNSSWLP